MHRLKETEENGRSCFYITETRPFSALGEFTKEVVDIVFSFSYGMSLGRSGEHRDHRSGGQVRREPGELYRDTFQGKIAEFGLRESLSKLGIKYPEPNLEMWSLGRWDLGDAEVGGKKLCIKSAKHFANLLLLETKDWGEDGQYVPNLKLGTSHYDLFILVRIRPSLEDLMKRSRLLYSSSVEKDKLQSVVAENVWEYDIPGFITQEQLLEVIRGKYVLPQNSYLNGTTLMDAENYYVQAGGMNDFSDIVSLLK